MSLQNSSFVDQALKYCDDVLAGNILVSTTVKQAVQRHLYDLAKVPDPDFRFTFDQEKAERACRFFSKLPHVAGRWATLKNNRFKLQPWQAFFFISVFGWVEKQTGYRRFREVFLSLSRKNGKSFIASAVCLYCLLCDHEPGAQVFAAANNQEQAMTVFRPAKQMVERLGSLRDYFEVEVNAKSLVTPDGSRFVPLVGVARDGQSAHCAVLDEYHEAKDDSLYLSLTQSMGARTQPLMLITTTAGVTIEGPCHQLQRDCEKVLSGAEDRPELFALIFTLDKETDWTSEDALVMANPNLGVSVNVDGLRTEQRNAVRNKTKQNAFKTKKLNVWCNASSAFFNMAHWADASDANLKPEQFEGKRCWMAADLSAKLDLTCVVKLFQDGNNFYVFPRFYLPEERATDPTLGMYANWEASGYLTATEGNVIDIEQIISETADDITKYKPVEFAFDDWQADFFTQMLGKRFPRLTLVNVAMNVRTLSPAMFEVEALLASKRLKHSANPVSTWNIANTVAKYDAKNNVFPRKDRDENKIDFVMCLLMATSRAMLQAKAKSTSKIVFA